MIRKRLVRDDMMDIKLTTFRGRLLAASLANKVISPFCQLALTSPMALIIDILASSPTRARSPFYMLRAPMAITFKRTKPTMNIMAIKFPVLAIKRFVALGTRNCLSSLCFYSAQSATVFTWFLAGNISINHELLATMLASFLDFRSMLHGTTLTCKNDMSSATSAMAGLHGKRCNGWVRSGVVR